MADIEEFLKMLGAVHKTSPFGYMFATPEEARNALARMGMITPPGEKFGLDTGETDASFGLFTGLNEAGQLFEGLEGDTDGYPANLSDIYETMDLRGTAGHYFLKPAARAIEGLRAAASKKNKEGIDRANEFLAETYKKIFAPEEELGGKKGASEGVVPDYDQKLGGLANYISDMQKRQELMQIVMGKHIAKRKNRGLSLEELKYFDESLGGGLDALTYGVRHSEKPVEEIGINYFIAKKIKGG